MYGVTLLFFLLITVVHYSCPHFHPITFFHPIQPNLPHSILLPCPPLSLSMGPLYMFLDHPSPSLPVIPLPPTLLVTDNAFQICLPQQKRMNRYSQRLEGINPICSVLHCNLGAQLRAWQD